LDIVIDVASVTEVASPARCPKLGLNEPFDQSLHDGGHFLRSCHYAAEIQVHNGDPVFWRSGLQAPLDDMLQVRKL
jgi:hypothetical protein